MFKGSIPALLTPFQADGRVDEKAFVAHVEWQISEGSSGLVPVTLNRFVEEQYPQMKRISAHVGGPIFY